MILKTCALMVAILAVMLQVSVAEDERCGLGDPGRNRSNDTLEATDYQLEGKERGETRGDDDEEDDSFDVDEDDTRISQDELDKLMKVVEQKDPSVKPNSQSRVARKATSPALSFPSLLWPWPAVYRDCPSWWRWGCPMQRRRLGCFRRGINQLCCPLWPTPIWTGYCKCHNCVTLKPRKAECGTCIRKYRWARFWARCRTINPLGPWTVPSARVWKRVAYRCCCGRKGTNQCI